MDCDVMSLLESSINEICRICLKKQQSMKHIFETNEKEPCLAELLRTNLNLEVEENINWPNSICDFCETDLNQVFNFKLKIESSQSILNQFLDLKKEEKFLDIFNNENVEIVKEEVTIKAEVDEDLSLENHPLTCNVCNSNFDTKISLRNHRKEFKHYIAKIKGSTYFKCQECSKTFSSLSNLKRHITALHVSEAPYVCDLCTKTFKRKEKLEAHRLIHGVIGNDKGKIDCEDYQKYKRTLSCDVCKQTFTLLSSLETHKLSHSDDSVLCNQCGKAYANEKKLMTHVSSVHIKKVKERFLCYICAKEFCNSFGLKRHIQEHQGIVNSYKCKVCSKSFTRSQTLLIHSRIHTGEKPCVCHICSRAFNKSYNLQRHIRTHSGVRPYLCTVCDKRFPIKYSLIVHTRIHTGEKPFICSVCNKGFVDRGSMRKHSKLHFKSETNSK